MVLPIGFFMPLPLPMMIPFMGIQSAVMAEQFGTMFQYGKRRISAMSNEEFNKLTPLQLQNDMIGQIEVLVPVMKDQMQMMRPTVKVIIEEFLQMFTQVGEALNPFTEGGPFYNEGGPPPVSAGHIPGGANVHVPKPQPKPEPVTSVTSEQIAKNQIDKLSDEMDNAQESLMGLKKKIQAEGPTNLGSYKTLEVYKKFIKEQVSYMYQLRKAFHDKYGYWY